MGKRKYTTTVQTGSTGFHLFMTVLTGGLWLLVWPFFRRRRVTTVRTYES